MRDLAPGNKELWHVGRNMILVYTLQAFILDAVFFSIPMHTSESKSFPNSQGSKARLPRSPASHIPLGFLVRPLLPLLLSGVMRFFHFTAKVDCCPV